MLLQFNMLFSRKKHIEKMHTIYKSPLQFYRLRYLTSPYVCSFSSLVTNLGGKIVEVVDEKYFVREQYKN